VKAKTIDSRTKAKAMKGLERTVREGTYYWRERAASVLNSLKNHLPLHRDEWLFWAKKA
jgi:hypothetical protein